MQEAIAAVIFNEQRTEVLLVQRRDIPVWVLPGGGIDRGETPEAAVIREVLEETGFQAEIVRKRAEYLPVNRLTQRTHLFECRILSGEARPSAETRAVRFFSLRHLPKFLAPPFSLWIQDALPASCALIRKPIEGASYGALMRRLCTHPLIVIRFLLTRLGIHWN
jgi:8-oxo-dGTP pyrophosphatase MutT (NUDIX family)